MSDAVRCCQYLSSPPLGEEARLLEEPPQGRALPISLPMVVLPPPARTLWPASPPARWSPWQPPPTEQQSCWERWRCRHWPQLITAFLLLRPRNPPPTRGASAHQYSNPIIFKPNNIQTQLYSNPIFYQYYKSPKFPPPIFRTINI